MYRVKVEKRGTRDWVLLKENVQTGYVELIDRFITKHAALRYLGKQKSKRL